MLDGSQYLAERLANGIGAHAVQELELLYDLGGTIVPLQVERL